MFHIFVYIEGSGECISKPMNCLKTNVKTHNFAFYNVN